MTDYATLEKIEVGLEDIKANPPQIGDSLFRSLKTYDKVPKKAMLYDLKYEHPRNTLIFFYVVPLVQDV